MVADIGIVEVSRPLALVVHGNTDYSGHSFTPTWLLRALIKI